MRGTRAAARTEVFSPHSLEAAVQLLAEVKEPVRILAGGTDLMVEVETGRSELPGLVLDISRIRDLRFVDEGDEGAIHIGPLVTFADVRRSALLREKAPALWQAAGLVGGEQIRNAATLGGNIMNASPAADGIPPLLAAETHVVLTSSEGSRRIPLFSFFKGYRTTVAKPEELLTEIVLQPLAEGAHAYFRKVAPRRAQAISKVVFAGRIHVARDGAAAVLKTARLGIGAVAPHALRLFETERLLGAQVLTPRLIEDAVRTLRSEIAPIDDVRSTADYRRAVAGNMLRAFLMAGLTRSESGKAGF